MAAATAQPTVLTAAKPARRRGLVSAVAVLAALLLIGLGAVLGQQALVHLGVLDWPGWLRIAADWFDSVTLASQIALAAGVAVLGLIAIAVALAAGARHELRLSAVPGLVVRRGDLASLASANADTVDGVVRASSESSGRQISVRIESTGGPEVAPAVERVVTERLATLDLHPNVRVRDTGRARAGTTTERAHTPTGADHA